MDDRNRDQAWQCVLGVYVGGSFCKIQEISSAPILVIR